MDTDNIIIIDYASGSSISGWSLNINESIFPKDFTFYNEVDKKKYSIEKFIEYRKDVSEHFNLIDNEKVGFNINLFDLFNDYSNNYSIMVGEKKIWSYTYYLNSIDNQITDKINLDQNDKGINQVLIFYNSGNWFCEILSKMKSLNSNLFNKAANRGISFLMINLNSINNEKITKIGEINNNSVLICESKDLCRILNLFPMTNSVRSKILIDKKISLQYDYIGLLSTLLKINLISDNDVASAKNIYKIITSLSSYSDLIFNRDSDEPFFVYHSGKIEPWMKLVVKNNIQGKLCSDLIIISKRKISSLSCIDDSCVIFININSLNYVYDIISDNKFIINSFKRGLKIIYINEDSLA